MNTIHGSLWIGEQNIPKEPPKRWRSPGPDSGCRERDLVGRRVARREEDEWVLVTADQECGYVRKESRRQGWGTYGGNHTGVKLKFTILLLNFLLLYQLRRDKLSFSKQALEQDWLLEKFSNLKIEEAWNWSKTSVCREHRLLEPQGSCAFKQALSAHVTRVHQNPGECQPHIYIIWHVLLLRLIF